MSGQQRRFWTDDEDAVLRADYHHVPRHEIAARLNRNVHSLHYRAGQLGLRRPQASRVQWTPERLAILQAEYRRTPTPELSARLGATIPAIRQQARIQGYHRPGGFHWTPERDAIVHNLAGVASSELIAERLGITQTMVLRRAKRLGVPFRSASASRYVRDQRTIRRLRLLLAASKGLVPMAAVAQRLGTTERGVVTAILAEAVAGADDLEKG